MTSYNFQRQTINRQNLFDDYRDKGQKYASSILNSGGFF